MEAPKLSRSRRLEALPNRKTEIDMSKIIGLMLLVLTVSAVAPAFANTNASCDQVPKSEWAQCVFDQAANGE